MKTNRKKIKVKRKRVLTAAAGSPMKFPFTYFHQQNFFINTKFYYLFPFAGVFRLLIVSTTLWSVFLSLCSRVETPLFDCLEQSYAFLLSIYHERFCEWWKFSILFSFASHNLLLRGTFRCHSFWTSSLCLRFFSRLSSFPCFIVCFIFQKENYWLNLRLRDETLKLQKKASNLSFWRAGGKHKIFIGNPIWTWSSEKKSSDTKRKLKTASLVFSLSKWVSKLNDKYIYSIRAFLRP